MVYPAGERQHRVRLTYEPASRHAVACSPRHLYVAERLPATDVHTHDWGGRWHMAEQLPATDVHIHNWRGRWLGRLQQPDTDIVGVCVWTTEHGHVTTATGDSDYVYVRRLSAYKVSNRRLADHSVQKVIYFYESYELSLGNFVMAWQ